MTTKKILTVSVVVLLFSNYTVWQSKNRLEERYTRTVKDLAVEKATNKHLTSELLTSNKLNDANSRKLQSLINQSTITQEKMIDEIKSIDCANQSIPDDIIKLLREHTNSIYSSTNSSESISSVPASASD